MVLDLANFVPYSHAVMKHRYRPWTATVLTILLAIGAVFSNTAAQGQDAANRPWPSVPQDGAKGRLAIVIDDVGYNRAAADAVIALPFPLTVSVLPHHPLSVNIANQAWRHGKQVLLHLPMEPQPGAVRPEDIQLRIGMEAGQIESLVAGMLETVPHAVGVSNHQGSLGVCRNNAKRVHSTTSPSHFGTILASGADASALKTDRLWGGHPTFSSRHDFSDTLLATADPRLMEALMAVLHKRGLFFIDSLTIQATVILDTAHRAGVRVASRAIFLDNIREPKAISRQLELAARTLTVTVPQSQPAIRVQPQLPLPEHKVMPVATETADGTHYLTAVLKSQLFNAVVALEYQAVGFR